MYICTKCGEVYDDYDLPTTTQRHGYTSLGDAFDEEIDDDCPCGGELVEATECKICGEWFDADGICGDVCNDCRKEYATVNDAIEMGRDDLVDIEINGFVAAALTNADINRILTKWCEENFVDGSRAVLEYLNYDQEYYAQHLIKEYGCE